MYKLKLSIFCLLFLFNLHASAFGKTSVIGLRGEEATATLKQLEKNLKENPNNLKTSKDIGILLHQISRDYPKKEFITKGVSILEKVTKENKEDFEALGWLGSIITMQALITENPGKKTFYVKLGARKMDKAISKDPDNLIIRLIRANNSLELPPFLKRTRFAVIDFEHAMGLCRKNGCGKEQQTDIRAKLEKAKKIVASMQ